LTTVDVPGHGAVALPPVCVPYSPEFRPQDSDRGLATLERLARATGGKERVEVAKTWEDLPRQPRLLSVARWLLLAAAALLLLEVRERRTGVLSWRRPRAPVTKTENPEPRPARKPVRAAPTPKPAAEPLPAPEVALPPVSPAPAPAASVDSAGVLE